MDILLIDPPYKALKGMGTECGYTVGLVSLGAYLRENGFDVGIISGDLLVDVPRNDVATQNLAAYAQGQQRYAAALRNDDHPVWHRIQDAVRTHRPTAVGISWTTPVTGAVLKTAAAIKAVEPSIKVLVGGHHPTFCPEDALSCDNIDYVLRGEGEIPLLALVQQLRRSDPELDLVPGLAYREADGEVRHTELPALIEDLDLLPTPARDLVLNCDYDRYRLHYVSTARGCPYHCSFCADKQLWGGKVRRRTVANVVVELKELVTAYDVKCVDFVDGTFTFDREYVERLCAELVRAGTPVQWRCTARLDNLDRGLVQTMKRAGCVAVYVGLESGSDRVLREINKGTTISDIVSKCRLLRENGVTVIASVLLGLPDETLADMRQTLSLMREVAVDVFDVNTYVPLPGTPLWGRLSEAERRAIDWASTSFKSYDTCFARHVPAAQFRDVLREAHAIAASTRTQ